jgi:parvulin-like peptidyl-prolyl isomerase
MKAKQLALVLAVLMCVGLFAGCQSSKLQSFSEDSTEEDTAATTSESETTTKDYTAAYQSYNADEVMMTVDGIDVSWGELFYWYVYDVSNMEKNYGDISDWDAACGFAEDKTNREYVMENALDTVKHYCALESKAKELGVSLNDDDKAKLQTTWNSNVKSYGNGDEETFLAYLQKAYLSKDLYDHINELSMLYERMLDNMFGANGEKLSDSEILEKSADMGYVRVKHILISTKDDSGTALTGDKLAEKKTQAESLLSELKGITDKTALEKRFDEMITEYGGDPGVEYYTEGYTFIPGKGTMDENFETAAGKLSEYELSDLVQSDYGYHIILRLPLTTTATVEYSSETSKTTLGYYVAQNMFGAETDNWSNESTVSFTKTYNDMDIAKVFEKVAATPAAS